MDEPMIISVVGNQDALWEAEEFWDEKISPESKVSDISTETETSLFGNKHIKTDTSLNEKDLKIESSSFDKKVLKTESTPFFHKDDIKTETVDRDSTKSENSFLEHVKLGDEICYDDFGLMSNHEIDIGNSKPQHEVVLEKDISIVDVAFVCGVCKSRFESEDLCKKHIELEHEQTPIEEKPPPKPSLKSYRIRRNDDDLKRKGEPALTVVPEKSLRTEALTPNVTPQTTTVSHFPVRASNMTQVLCATCGARFFHQKTLSRHMQNQHGVRETLTSVTFTALLYACDFCGAKFSRYRTMLDHYKSEHKTIEAAPVDMPCLTCDEAFKTYKQLEDHVMSEQHTLQWFCFLCEQKFSKDMDFRNHNCPQKSSGDFTQNCRESKLVCTICSKIFFGRKLFSKHIDRCRVKETCQDCIQQFDKVSDWFRHKLDCADIQVLEVHPAKS